MTKQRRGKNHLQFPLFSDESIGFGSANRFALIENSADEDYETDKEILKRTINVCKKDCWQVLGPHAGKVNE